MSDLDDSHDVCGDNNVPDGGFGQDSSAGDGFEQNENFSLPTRASAAKIFVFQTSGFA